MPTKFKEQEDAGKTWENLLSQSQKVNRSNKPRKLKSSDNQDGNSPPKEVQQNSPKIDPTQKLQQKAEEIIKNSRIEEIEEKVTEEFTESQIFHF